MGETGILTGAGILSESELSLVEPAGPRRRYSANGDGSKERLRLDRRYEERTVRSSALNRRLVSYQGNKKEPGFRWMKFKEGFSRAFVRRVIKEVGGARVLDPFSGIGTTVLTASACGASGTGIELLPVGMLAAEAMYLASGEVGIDNFRAQGSALLERVSSHRAASIEHKYQHVRITERAFSQETEEQLAKAREFVAQMSDWRISTLLNFACMSVLEDVSFTRKDGQYLRWDYRSGRQLRSHVDIGPVVGLEQALEDKIDMISHDMGVMQREALHGEVVLLRGSSLERLGELEDGSFDLVITSPPYANRYDYTRTYALELAWLGLDQRAIAELRQQLITATVENHSKVPKLETQVGRCSTWRTALEHYESHRALREVLESLRRQKGELSNPHVIRLLEGYFVEMAYVIAELARVLEPGGTVVMVNDNVQYHGEAVPVDQILGDFAEGSGLSCDKILTLPRGKGNSSQQMGRFGRTELRKCVYVWSKPNG